MDRLNKDFKNAKAISDLVESKLKPAIDGWEDGQSDEWWDSYDGSLARTQDISDVRRELLTLAIHGISDSGSAYEARSIAEQALEQKLPPGNMGTVVFSLCKVSLAKHAIEEGKLDEARCLLVDIQNFSAGNGKVTDERLLSLIQAFAKAHAADI
jgi:hypothetical protein